MLGEAAETAALDEAGDADGGASAALDVAAGFVGDGVIGLHPDSAGAAGGCSLGGLFAGATLRDEIVVEGDVVHVAGPDEEGIGAVGSALVAVAAALHDEAEIFFAGKVDGGGNVRGILGGDGVDAGLGE